MSKRKPVFHGCPNDDDQEELFACPVCLATNFTKRGLQAHKGSAHCRYKALEAQRQRCLAGFEARALLSNAVHGSHR